VLREKKEQAAPQGCALLASQINQGLGWSRRLKGRCKNSRGRCYGARGQAVRAGRAGHWAAPCPSHGMTEKRKPSAAESNTPMEWGSGWCLSSASGSCPLPPLDTASGKCLWGLSAARRGRDGPAAGVIARQQARADVSTNARSALETRRKRNLKTAHARAFSRGRGPHAWVPGKEGDYSLGLLKFTQQV